MTGHDKNDEHANRPRKAGNVLLYSLIAIVAAIAGFLTTTLFDRFSGGESVNGQATAQAVVASSKAAENAASGFEKLVQSGEPKELPSVTFVDAGGKERSLSDWQGKVVLVNLWATWCAPCRIEMPDLNRLQASLGGDDFTVLPINLDWSGADKPRKFLKSEDLDNLPLYLDKTKSVMQKLGAIGLPLTIIVDQQGREVARLAGAAKWDSDEAKAFIRKIISQKSES